MAPTTSARLDYLSRAAARISTKAPTTSSALRLQHASLAQTVKPGPLNARPLPRHCPTCGCELAGPPPPQADAEHAPSPRLSSSSRRRLRKTRLLKSRESARPIFPSVIECSRCHRRAASLHGPSRPSINSTSAPSTMLGQPDKAKISAPLTGNADSRATSTKPQSSGSSISSSAGGRKRAKARKQGGLQAMLANTKSASTASSNLGLMDFMKSG